MQDARSEYLLISRFLTKILLFFLNDEFRFDLNHVPNNTQPYINEISKIFMSNIKRECINDCTSAASTDILIQLFVELNETQITWHTDESYSIEVITRGG